jgi:hypothetical protein
MTCGKVHSVSITDVEFNRCITVRESDDALGCSTWELDSWHLAVFGPKSQLFRWLSIWKENLADRTSGFERVARHLAVISSMRCVYNAVRYIGCIEHAYKSIHVLACNVC